MVLCNRCQCIWWEYPTRCKAVLWYVSSKAVLYNVNENLAFRRFPTYRIGRKSGKRQHFLVRNSTFTLIPVGGNALTYINSYGNMFQGEWVRLSWTTWRRGLLGYIFIRIGVFNSFSLIGMGVKVELDTRKCGRSDTLDRSLYMFQSPSLYNHILRVNHKVLRIPISDKK